MDGRLLQRGQQICRTLDERAGTTSNPLWEVLVQREMEAASEAKLPEVPPLLSMQAMFDQMYLVPLALGAVSASRTEGQSFFHGIILGGGASGSAILKTIGVSFGFAWHVARGTLTC